MQTHPARRSIPSKPQKTMPFIPHTPEALVGRSDSKNPATTCKGITTNGRPCRRALASSKSSSGVLAVVSIPNSSDDDAAGAAAYFCWQHKDQADKLAAASASSLRRVDEETQILPLQEKTSIDSLVHRLGVLEVDENSPSKGKSKAERRRNRQTGVPHPRRRPPTWENVPGPLLSVPTDMMSSGAVHVQGKPSRPRPSKAKDKQTSFWRSLFCGRADDDYVEVVRHRRRADGQSGYMMTGATQQSGHPSSSSLQNNRPLRPNEPNSHASYCPSIPVTPQNNRVPARKPLGEKPALSLNKPVSKTSNLMSLIPKTVSPQTASALLAELSKPISAHDEAGYIYIFWLTDEHVAPPPARAASTLLSPHPQVPRGRRPSDVLSEYSWRALDDSVNSHASKTTPEKKTILLKIGRANNIQRRMNEWTRQCGYALSLVRWYPYVSSSPSASQQTTPTSSRRPSLQSPHSSASSNTHSAPQRPPLQPSSSSGNQVRKVPHAHRVERLIHLELGDRRVKRRCDACGKEHREWFEVEASRKGIMEMDDVVRRWVDWAEQVGGGGKG